MPARYVLERADWTAAAALAITESRYPQADALTRFTRGLGLARSGQVGVARQELQALTAHQATLQEAGDTYWSDRVEEQVTALSAWILLAEGTTDRAIAEMRRAVDGEDSSIKHVAMENRLYPLRELLGDLLLEARQPAAALVEFERALKSTPNRYRGLYGAARAAAAVGNKERAATYYAGLIALAKSGDGTRPELSLARSYLGR